MSANPDALLRLAREFTAVEPDAVLSGIFAAKGGYHNTRNNHLAGREGGSPSDYSIQDPLDKQGSGDLAAAIDITFRSAQGGDFRTIAKYSNRLYVAFRDRDPRLFYDGKPVVREFFGNIDLDRDVEGWSLYRARAASSDTSHLWHDHISFHRWAVGNWPAVSGVLSVLLATKPEPLPTQGDVMELSDQVTLPKWFVERYPDDAGIADGSVTVQTALVAGYVHAKVAREEVQALHDYTRQHHADVLANVQQNETAIHQLAQQVAELIARLDPADPPPAEEPASTYTVQPGDTLGEIAERLGVDVDALAEHNHISDPDRIFPGQVLQLP